jgi:hypothetical protein
LQVLGLKGVGEAKFAARTRSTRGTKAALRACDPHRLPTFGKRSTATHQRFVRLNEQQNSGCSYYYTHSCIHPKKQTLVI